jgi:ABC-2 type transport system permease protein
MSLHRLLAVARKEVIQILRDPRSLTIVVLMPVILMFLFGYGINLDLKHTPMYVLDRDGSPASRELLSRFRASQYFAIVRHVDNYPELVAALDAGRCKLALVIPHDFSEGLRRGGGPVAVQALVDATDDNTANLVLGYTESVVRSYSQSIQVDWAEQRGQPRTPPPIAVRSRTWFNENLESQAFIIPGIVAIVMAVVGAFLTSLTIAREWERGTMEQLISTPVSSLEVMLGKLIPYFVIGFFDTAVCTGMAILWFGVPFRGSLLTLFAGSAMFLTVVMSQGFFISVVAKSQLAASQIALISTFLPAFLLSGFLFSIEQMPRAIQVFTHIVPARYYVTLMKAVFLKGTPVSYLQTELLALAVFALLLVLLATRVFQKRLE